MKFRSQNGLISGLVTTTANAADDASLYLIKPPLPRLTDECHQSFMALVTFLYRHRDRIISSYQEQKKNLFAFYIFPLLSRSSWR